MVFFFFLVQLNLTFLSKWARAKQLTLGFRGIQVPHSEAGQAELGASCPVGSVILVIYEGGTWGLGL